MKPFIPLCTALVGFAVGLWSRDSQVTPPASSPTPIAPAQQEPERTDTLSEVLRALRLKPGLQQFAALSEPLTRLNSAQMGALIERIERDSHQDSDWRSTWLFKWWLERDPDAASAWVLPRFRLLAQDRTDVGLDADGISQMIGSWAEKFPADALKLALEKPQSGLAGSLLFYVLKMKKDRPESESWSVLRDFPESRGRVREAERFIKKWAEKDTAAAFAAAQALAAGGTRDSSLAAVLPELAAKDAAFAFEQYNKLGLSDPELVTKMIAGAAAKDPAGIAEWLTGLDAVQFKHAAPWLVQKWAAQDPAAAFHWAAEHKVKLTGYWDFEWGDRVSYTHSGLGRSMSWKGSSGGPSAVVAAMSKKPEATISWLNTLPFGPERDRMTSLLITAAKADQAIQLFNTLPPEARRDGAYKIASKLTHDPKRGTEWIATLPAGLVRERAWYAFGQIDTGKYGPSPGRDRDAFLSGQAFRFGVTDPEYSLNTMLKIANPTKRREVFDSAMQRHTTSQSPTWPENARAWMEHADIPDEWKTKWRVK